MNTQLPNGVHSSYIYDKLNRLTNPNTNKGAITSYGYKLGSAGNRLSVAELGRTVEYKYDDIYRLTREIIGTADISYYYDSVGNRLSRTSLVAGISSTTETYDNNDRINSDSYDENGSTTTSNGKTYSYDFEQRLISVTGGGVDISIIYDGDGNRVSKSVTTGGVTTTTKYLVDENNPTGYAQVAEEIQNKKVIRQYTYGNDLISENQLIAGSWKVSFYGYDGHGSVRFLTDSAGAKTDSYAYDTFGILINKTGLARFQMFISMLAGNFSTFFRRSINYIAGLFTIAPLLSVMIFFSFVCHKLALPFLNRELVIL